MLELRNVSKHYSSIPAVENVSFSAHPGEITGYLGANGSDKSTTMKMITALIEMSSGEISFEGKPIQSDLMAYKQLRAAADSSGWHPVNLSWPPCARPRHAVSFA